MNRNLRRIARDPLVWIVLLTAAYAAILAWRPAEAWFGVPGEWTWSGRPPAASTLLRWPLAIAALLATAAFAAAVDRQFEQRSRTWRVLALAVLVLAVPVLQVLLKHIHYRYPLEFYLHRTIGPHNGFWQAAIAIESLPDYLRTYPEAMRSAREAYIHLATHPPGNVLYLYGWRRLFELLPGVAHTLAHAFRAYACSDLGFVRLSDARIAAALGQMLAPVWSGLAVAPVYAWARQLGGRRAGWRAAALVALLPTLSLFTLRWDTVYPLFTASAFAALHRGLVTGRARWWLLAGIAVSVASFCSFGNAILAPAVALYAVLVLWQRAGRPGAVVEAWPGWGALLVGGYSVWGVFHLATGVSVWELLAVTGGIQAELRAAYSYGSWLAYNLVDILALSGFAVTAPFLIEAIRSLRAAPDALRRQNANAPGRAAAWAPALTFAAVLLALDLSGLSPGEVGRLWLHLTVGMVVVAALWLERLQRRWAFPLLVGLLAFQGLWLTLFLRVSETGMPSYMPRQPAVTEAAGEAAAVRSPVARFEHGLTLAAARVMPSVAAPESSVQVHLVWYAGERTDVPYTAFVHVVGADGALLAQQDGMPLDNALPTTCWVPGETIRDTVTVNVPASAPPGRYRVVVGWYDLVTMDRVPLLEGGDQPALAGLLEVVSGP